MIKDLKDDFGEDDFDNFGEINLTVRLWSLSSDSET